MIWTRESFGKKFPLLYAFAAALLLHLLALLVFPIQTFHLPSPLPWKPIPVSTSEFLSVSQAVPLQEKGIFSDIPLPPSDGHLLPLAYFSDQISFLPEAFPHSFTSCLLQEMESRQPHPGWKVPVFTITGRGELADGTLLCIDSIEEVLLTDPRKQMRFSFDARFSKETGEIFWIAPLGESTAPPEIQSRIADLLHSLRLKETGKKGELRGKIELVWTPGKK